jgi:hypothetical protein
MDDILDVFEEVERPSSPKPVSTLPALKAPRTPKKPKEEERVFPNAVTTASLAPILRSFLAKGGPDDDQHTLTWLAGASGVSTKTLRAIVAEVNPTTKEKVADKILAALDRVDLFFSLEFVFEKPEASSKKTRCVSS